MRTVIIFGFMAFLALARTGLRYQRHEPLKPKVTCEAPIKAVLAKSCAEYHEALAILKGDRGFDPVEGIHPFTSFELRPAKGGPLVHDSIQQAECETCKCRADAGSYDVIGFSKDHKQVLMERMSDQDESDVCDRGTRFFIPLVWLRPPGQHVSLN